MVEDRRPLIIEDARTDERLRANPAIAEYSAIAYAGFPLRSPLGWTPGTSASNCCRCPPTGCCATSWTTIARRVREKSGHRRGAGPGSAGARRRAAAPAGARQPAVQRDQVHARGRHDPGGGRRRDDAAVIEISDTGIGIPAEQYPHLFSRFFRASNATRDGIKGTGLGLAVTKAIVDAHDGEVSARPASAAAPRSP